MIGEEEIGDINRRNYDRGCICFLKNIGIGV